MLSEGERLTLEIEKVVYGGDGLGRWRGLAVFVPRTAPGDVARVEIVSRKKRFARARLLALETAASCRTARRFSMPTAADLRPYDTAPTGTQ